MRVIDILEQTPDELPPGGIEDLSQQIANAQERIAELQAEIDQLDTATSSMASHSDELVAGEKKRGALANILSKWRNKLASLRQEKSQLENPDHVLQVLDRIDAECGEYIAEARRVGRWLYRGSNSYPSAFRARSKSHRYPRDSKLEMQEIFDKLLVMAGCTALRSNSIFSSSDILQTQEYGETYIVFPVNGQSSFTSGSIKDLVMEDISNVPGYSRDIVLQYVDRLLAAIDAIPAHQEVSEMVGETQSILERFKKEDWWGNPFEGWLRSHTVKDWLAHAGIPTELYDVDLMEFIDQKAFLNQYAPNCTSMYLAIQSEKEVLITGLYYGLRRSDYAHFVEQKWHIPA